MRCPERFSLARHKRLTDRKLQTLKRANAGKRYDVMDGDVRGLGVRVTDTGRRSFILIARYPGSSNPTRRALGEYPTISLDKARAKARRWHEQIGRGIDPRDEEEKERLAELRKKADTFDAVVEDFARRVLPKQRRGKIVEREIKSEFVSQWKGRSITSITRRDVLEVVNQAIDRGAPYQARNLLGHVRALFNWAIEAGDYGLETSPCDRIRPKVLIGVKAPRDRVLTDAEIKAVWRAATQMGYPFGPLIQLLMLTGVRKTEASGARWTEFDLDAALWNVPADRFKSKSTHLVPLSKDAIALLKALPRVNKGDHLFSTSFGFKSATGFGKAKERLDRLVDEDLGEAPAPFRLHRHPTHRAYSPCRTAHR